MAPHERPEHRIDPERLKDAMRRRGIASKAALAKQVRVWPSNVKRWIDGDTTPAGDTLERLCSVLGCSPAYLFHKEEDDSQAAELVRVLNEVERMLGRTARDAVQSLSQLSKHHRTIAIGRLQGWIQALADVERATGQMPLTEFDLDEAELEAEQEDQERRGPRQPAGGASIPRT